MVAISMSRTGRIISLIVIAVAAAIALSLYFWQCQGELSGKDTLDAADTIAQKSDSANTVTTEPESSIDAELMNITNSITWEFSTEDPVQSHFEACAAKTKRIVENSTNDIFRLIIAKHLAAEALHIDFINSNYKVRGQGICAFVDCIVYANESLRIAGVSQFERCKFIFDALSNFKYGLLHTLAEKPVKTTEADRYGRGPKWAQRYCKRISPLHFAGVPKYLVNTLFRRMYPKLSPDMKDYFKLRFREVFGIDYIPDAPGRTAYLKGDESTRWDGKGLKWRICNDRGNWSDADGKVPAPDKDVRASDKDVRVSDRDVRASDKDIEVFTGGL